jgi:de-etiolated-1
MYKISLYLIRQHQTVHIYQIIEGTFQLLRSIGRFCCDEESYLFNSYSTPSTPRPFREDTINGLKHRILIFLYRQAQEKYDEGDKMALRRFYRIFYQVRSLRMWKIQLLDEDTLLLKYASEDVVTLKANEPNSHTSVTFVIYNIWEKKVLAVYNNTSEELLYLFENFCDCFRNPRNSFRSQWSCNNANNIHANLLHQRFKQTIVSAKGGGVIEARKRLLAQLPISAQSYSSSPYLDLSLFSFDDKFVSQMERPKQASEFPIRFFARDSGLLRFKIHTGFKGSSSINSRRLVAFLFHPHEPFAISIQRINSNYIANLHVWNSSVSLN